MKNEKPILIAISLFLLAFAIFASYNTQFPQDGASEKAYLTDIADYKTDIADKIAGDNKRIEAFSVRAENGKSAGTKSNELSSLREKINEMQTKLNNYDGNDSETWTLFKKKFDYDLSKLHQSIREQMSRMPISDNLNPKP